MLKLWKLEALILFRDAKKYIIKIPQSILKFAPTLLLLSIGLASIAILQY